MSDSDLTPQDGKEPEGQERPRPPRWKVSLVIAGIALIQIGNIAASFSLFALIAKQPLGLVLLQPTTKNLLIVANSLPLVTYFVVAVLRRQVPHVLWFLIGRWYGDASIRWISKRDPNTGRLLAQLEGWFPRFGWLICLLYPHPLVCAMAGASSMSFLAFMVYTFIGIIGYVWAARAFGDWASPVTGAITDFSGEYVIPLTVLSVVTVGFFLWNGSRKGDSKLESMNKMEDELEQERRNDER